jgi:hypothetical protein
MTVIPFQTKVKVIKNLRADNGKLIREEELIRGLVVEDCGSFVRVWNPELENSAKSPEYAELFAVSGKDCWCEIIGETKTLLAVGKLGSVGL